MVFHKDVDRTEELNFKRAQQKTVLGKTSREEVDGKSNLLVLPEVMMEQRNRKKGLGFIIIKDSHKFILCHHWR